MALVYSPEVPAGKATPVDSSPSPTLTNPDMILPRRPYSGYSSSPSPDRAPLASSPTLRQGDFVIPISSSSPDASAEIGIATTAKMPIRVKPLAPSAFAGYEHGAPLSDIGEEETIASTTPRSRVTRQSRTPSPVHPLSPTPAPRSYHPENLPQKRDSISATSDGSDEVDWENFDTSQMMSGRLAADVAKQQEKDALESKRNSMISAVDGDDMAILNDRAEKILDDARKRLTHMEDNLSKARHSMLWSPRSSPNISDFHHPAGSLYRSISLAGGSRRYSRPGKDSPIHARGSSDTTPSGLKRLSMVPETRSSSAQEYARTSESPQYYSRSSPSTRIHAHSPASSQSVQSPMRTLEEEDDGSDPSTSKTSPEAHGPKGLGIDTMTADSGVDQYRFARTPSLNRSASAASLGRSESAASTRSIRESMTDLRLRINDIKAKSQADKERRRNVQSRHTPSPFTAQANPEKWYTSAAAYRQPGSPINANAGEGWSPSHASTTSLDAQVTPRTPNARDLLQVETPHTEVLPIATPTGRTDVNTPNLARRGPKATADAKDSVIDESQYEDAAQELDEDDQVAASEEEQVYLNEALEESLQDVEPEVPDIPEHLLQESNAERHEDRLDAFDYENMFLHSAMGNYRNSPDSDTSDTESVETSRADQLTPTADRHEAGEKSPTDKVETEEEQEREDEEEHKEEEDETFNADEMPTPTAIVAPPKPWMRPMRTNSVESVSTEASFATATEGSHLEDPSDDEDEDGVPREILTWGNGSANAFPTPPLTSPRRENIPNRTFPTPPTSGRIASPVSNGTHQALRIVTISPPRSKSHSTNNSISKDMLTPVRSPAAESASTTSARTVTSNGNGATLSRPQQTQHTQSPRSSISNGSNTTTTTTRSGEPHPANTEILMESLIKLADPDFSIFAPSEHHNSNAAARKGGGAFADIDKDLVLALLREVGSVCSGVLKEERRGEEEAVRRLRGRLEGARVVLEGRRSAAGEAGGGRATAIAEPNTKAGDDGVSYF